MENIKEYFIKIKRILSKHDSELTILKERVMELERYTFDPWKLPFD